MIYNYEYERLYDEILHTYINEHPVTYPISKNIAKSINKPFSISYVKNKMIISFEIQLTYQEEELLDNVINDCKQNFFDNILNFHKEKKIKEIKNNQEIIESKGFEYPAGSGFYFDMSTYSTTAWNGMVIAANAGLLPLPTGVRDVNDRLHFLNTQEEVAMFYGSGLQAKAIMYAETAAYISQIKQMTNIMDVIQFVDPRI